MKSLNTRSLALRHEQKFWQEPTVIIYSNLALLSNVWKTFCKPCQNICLWKFLCTLFCCGQMKASLWMWYHRNNAKIWQQRCKQTELRSHYIAGGHSQQNVCMLHEFRNLYGCRNILLTINAARCRQLFITYCNFHPNSLKHYRGSTGT